MRLLCPCRSCSSTAHARPLFAGGPRARSLLVARERSTPAQVRVWATAGALVVVVAAVVLRLLVLLVLLRCRLMVGLSLLGLLVLLWLLLVYLRLQSLQFW